MSKLGGFLQSMLLVFSLLTSMFLLYDISTYKSEMVRISSEVLSLDKKLDVKAGNWLYHVEKRINSTAQAQDEYVITVHDRMTRIEERITEIEGSKNSVNNHNSPTNNQQNSNTQNIYIGRDYPVSPENKKEKIE